MIDRYDPDLLLAYIEDELEGQELARFEQMMEEDAQLAALMQGLTSDRATLRSLPEVQTPPGLVDDALHQLERTMLLDGPAQDDAGPIPIQRGREFTAPIPGRHWGRIMGIGGMAAAVMIGAGLTYYVLLDDPLNRTALEMMQEEQDPASPAATGTDHNAEFAEADGVGRRNNNAIGNNAPGPTRSTGDIASRPGGAGGPAERGAPQPLEAPMADAQDPAGNSGLLDRAADAILAGPLAPGLSEDPPITEPTRDPGPSAQPPARPGTHAPVIALARNGLTEFDAAAQLLVYTDSPETTQQQIFAWCVNNGIPVVETDQWVDEDVSPDQAFADNAADRRNANSTTQLALLIEDQQLGELVAAMNTIEVPRANRQRAVLNQAQIEPQQRAQVRQQASGDEPTVPSPLQTAQAEGDEDYYQLKAPSDLGDEQLTDQNFDNVYRYNNRIATEGGYGQAAQTAQAPPAQAEPAAPVAQAQPVVQPMAAAAEQADDAEAVAPSEAVAEAESRHEREDGQDEGVHPAPAPVNEAQELRDNAPADALPQRQAQRDMEREAQDPASNAAAWAEDADRPRRAAPRGNHLMPQLPLANTTPIWSETAQTRIVPIILRFAGADAIESLDAAGAEGAGVATESEPAAEAEVETEAEAEAAEAEVADPQAGDAAAPADE